MFGEMSFNKRYSFLLGLDFYVSKVVSTHRTGTHPEQPLPTSHKGIPFIVGVATGIATHGCAMSGCVASFLECFFGELGEE